MPQDAGIGQAPHRLANAASERSRSVGRSPARISISAAMSGPMPNASRSAGAAWAVTSRILSWVLMSASRCCQWRAIDRSVLARGELVGHAPRT